MPGSKKRVVLCDIDGTLITGETQFCFLWYLFRRKRISFPLFLTVLFWFLLYRFGLMRDTDRVRKAGYTVFAGCRKDDLGRMARELFDHDIKGRLRPDILRILQDLNDQGCRIIFLSASLADIVEPIQDHLGFGQVLATRLEVRGGVLTGKIDGKPVYGQEKIAVVDKFLQSHGLDWTGSVALADHISDLPLLSRAGRAIAVAPDRELRKAARDRGWEIR